MAGHGRPAHGLHADPGRQGGRLRGRPARRQREAPARGRGQRRLHPWRGAPLRGPRRDGRVGSGLLRERGGVRRAGRLHRGPPRRAGGRRHLPRGGGQVHLLLAAQRALVVLRLERPRRGGRQGGGEELGPQGEGDPGLLRALHLLPHPQGRPLHGLSPPPRRLLVLPRRQRRHRVLLGDGAQPRPDLLRGHLLEGRLRLRPRAALRRGLAVAGHVPHVPLPVPGDAHDPRPRHRRGRAGRHAGQHGLRRRLERPAHAARLGARHRERPQVQQPHLQPALPGELQPGHEPDRALVGGPREGPAPGRPERFHGHDQHLFRHGLRADQRAAARPLPAPLPAPGRVGRGRVRAPGRRGPAPVGRRPTRSTTGRASTSPPPSRGRSDSASWSSTPPSATATPATARASG